MSAYPTVTTDIKTLTTDIEDEMPDMSKPMFANHN